MIRVVVPVPVIRLPRDQDPRFQPHVLVVTGDTPDERDWEVEHPRFCPRVCRWWPGARDALARDDNGGIDGLPPLDISDLDCGVAWEVGNVGLDSLSGEVGGVYYEGWAWRENPGWRAIPAGRYRIGAWYTPGGWAGADPVDQDGGMDLLGVEEDE